MPMNRILQHFTDAKGKKSGAQPVPPAGFTAVPTAPLAKIDVHCEEQHSIYEMAYLLARMGYVVGK